MLNFDAFALEHLLSKMTKPLYTTYEILHLSDC
jgi:hypothetical protein